MSESKSWKPWTAEEDATLRAIYADLTITSPTQVASEKLGRSRTAIAIRASSFKITRRQLKAIAVAAERPKPEPIVNRWQPSPKRALETVPDFLRDSFIEMQRRRPAS